MKFLIDTHILIWFLEDSEKLDRGVKESLLDTQNQVFVSQASIWEMAIKISLGKLKIPMLLEELLFHLERVGWSVLSIKNADIILLLTLPYIHSDPFDRIMVCQCKRYGYKLITRDLVFEDYGVKVMP